MGRQVRSGKSEEVRGRGMSGSRGRGGRGSRGDKRK